MKLRTKVGSEGYPAHVKEAMPKSNVLWEVLRAFVVGGGICTLGQLLRTIAQQSWGMSEIQAGAVTSILLIAAAAILTGLGVYDILGKFAGAGSIVPITGFSNSMVSPALEFRTEGYILGLGAKLFTVAGPVLVYGIGASMVYGVIYWIYTVV